MNYKTTRAIFAPESGNGPAPIGSTALDIAALERAALLNRAATLHVDLLIMGAYVHSRLRQLFFGGSRVRR